MSKVYLSNTAVGEAMSVRPETCPDDHSLNLILAGFVRVLKSLEFWKYIFKALKISALHSWSLKGLEFFLTRIFDLWKLLLK